MDDLLYPVLVRALHKTDGGGYIAVVPDLLGCLADGETASEALANVTDAIAEWIEECKRLNWPVPSPNSSFSRAAAERETWKRAVKERDEIIALQRKLVDEQKAGLEKLESQLADLSKKVEEITGTHGVVDNGDEWHFVPVSVTAADWKGAASGTFSTSLLAAITPSTEAKPDAPERH